MSLHNCLFFLKNLSEGGKIEALRLLLDKITIEEMTTMSILMTGYKYPCIVKDIYPIEEDQLSFPVKDLKINVKINSHSNRDILSSVNKEPEKNYGKNKKYNKETSPNFSKCTTTSDKYNKNSRVRFYKYECKTCEYKTPNKYNYKRHMYSHADSNECLYKYECKTCDYKTQRKENIYRHVNIHYKSKKICISNIN